MNTRIQLRGHCQHCAREQAVVNGFIAKHGYTVEHGFFQGTCNGSHFAPIENDRKEADRMLAHVAKTVKELRELAEKYQLGTLKPTTVTVKRYVAAERKTLTFEVPFESLEAFRQTEHLRSLCWNLNNRARAGEDFAQMLAEVVEKHHGQTLREVEIDTQGPAPIVKGERRIGSSGKILECTRVEGARVYWVIVEGRGGRGWTGVAAWRKLPTVEK